MVSILDVVMLSAFGAVLFAIGVVIGAFLMFRGKAQPGEGFIRTPKGTVFTVKDSGDQEFPGEALSDVNVKKQSERFLSALLGEHKG
jgi:hypothetical protein